MTTETRPLVLVTGATGYIAGHCIRELLEHGYRVRGTVRSLADPTKTEHLRRIAAQLGGSLELVEADLTADRGWRDAATGCTYVQHVASPFPAEVPKDEMDLIRPAVDGAKRVLQASADSGTVKRVVMTSSVAAVAFGHKDGNGAVRTEADWSIAENCDAYPKSKTLAERAAWDFVAALPTEQRFELAVINPGFVLGPLLNADQGTSGEPGDRLRARRCPRRRDRAPARDGAAASRRQPLHLRRRAPLGARHGEGLGGGVQSARLSRTDRPPALLADVGLRALRQGGAARAHVRRPQGAGELGEGAAGARVDHAPGARVDRRHGTDDDRAPHRPRALMRLGRFASPYFVARSLRCSA